MLDVRARFEAKVTPEALSGCHRWTGAYGQPGYGRFGLNKKTVDAHRVAWTLYRGPIPEGMCVCHTCDNRACVNPDHLFLGSHKDNLDDCIRKGRFPFKTAGDNSDTPPEVIAELRAIKGRLKHGQMAELISKHGLSAGGIYKLRKGLRCADARH